MEAIKPCPFCGEPDALYCLPILAEYMVHCNTCSATGPRTVRHDDAILLWNAAANALEAVRAERDEAIGDRKKEVERNIAMQETCRTNVEFAKKQAKLAEELQEKCSELQRQRDILRKQRDAAVMREACLGYSQIQASLVEQRDEVIAERDEARDVLDAYTTVIAARDEDERLYQDEITHLERQVATLEQQLQTELDMRNTHAVEEVEKYKAERDEAKKINETVYPKFLALKEDVVELRDKHRCLQSQLDYYKKMTNDLIAERDRLEGILQGERQSFIACGKDLLSQRDEARKWAREYKRRLIQAAKAMRGEK